jgi:hypothetical protein
MTLSETVLRSHWGREQSSCHSLRKQDGNTEYHREPQWVILCLTLTCSSRWVAVARLLVGPVHGVLVNGRHYTRCGMKAGRRRSRFWCPGAVLLRYTPSRARNVQRSDEQQDSASCSCWLLPLFCVRSSCPVQCTINVQAIRVSVAVVVMHWLLAVARTRRCASGTAILGC